MNQLFGPLWRLHAPKGKDEIRLIFMSAGNTRVCESVVTQMIDPKKIAKIRHAGCEWVVKRVHATHEFPSGHRIAGHKRLVFDVKTDVTAVARAWENIDGPDGLEVELVDGCVIELIGCSRDEYIACPGIPHHIRLVAG